METEQDFKEMAELIKYWKQRKIDVFTKIACCPPKLELSEEEIVVLRIALLGN